MARLGIDFGTTNTVVALEDRGSCPIVLHTADSSIGRISQDVFPSVSFCDRATGEWMHGLEAERRAGQPVGPRGTVVRSLKRLLGRYVEGMPVPDDGDAPAIDVRDLLTAMLDAVRESVLAGGLVRRDEPLETVITWPAHADGAQRIVTRDAFARAGFTVVGSLNEPTAAAVEYADRASGGDLRRARRLRATIAVFDFGGGTFDVSLVRIDASRFHVVATSGVDRLGGDDLDRLLLDLLLTELGASVESLGAVRTRALLRYARTLKETLASGAPASLVLNPPDWDLTGPPVFIPVERYLEAARPLITQAVDRVEQVLTAPAARQARVSRSKLDGIYLVGGSSRFPLVRQLVAERFPRTRVITSDKPFTSVAVGAAIHAGQRVRVRDIFSRHFGVVRLADDGQREVFDPIFRAGARLPGPGDPPLEIQVRYSPRHNIGMLRYLECTELGPAQTPGGNGRPWSPVLLPYDPGLGLDAAVQREDVHPTDAFCHTEVEERYRCDSDGVITMEFTRLADGVRRRFEIFCDD